MNELVKRFYIMIKELDALQYLENHLRYQLSPVIRGIKPATTVNMSAYKGLYEMWDSWGEQILKQLRLSYAILRRSKCSTIVLVYKKNLIEDILKDDKIGVFLGELGYKTLGVGEVMRHLVERYNHYHCPHELGIFVGIPLVDVEDFINCTAKKCLLCGYWKVYNNPEQAREIFSQYDRSKREMLLRLLKRLEA